MTAAVVNFARPNPRVGLGPLLGSWVVAVALAASVVVQSVGQYANTFVPAPAPAAAHATQVATTPPVLGVQTDMDHGVATLALKRFTTPAAAELLGERYGMQLTASYPAFGRYLYSLPQIRVQPGDSADTALISFPPLATLADIKDYLAANQLTLKSWVRSGEPADGRSALVSLPQVTPELVDGQQGIWRASIPKHIDGDKLSAWAASSNIQVISYDASTGELLIQGPKQPEPVYSVVSVTTAQVATLQSSATTSQPQH